MAAKLTDAQVTEIRQRAAVGFKWGEQKVAAYDFGITPSHLCQILKGARRKPRTRPYAPNFAPTT